MITIEGALQNYAWGIPDGLASWRQKPSADVVTGQPDAELWFGVHPNGMSTIVDGDVDAGQGEVRELSELLDANQAPILVKLLAAAKPLSLQIHPSAELAAEIIDRQNQIADYPHLLSDPYAKTEMIIAVTDFSGLLGLRDTRMASEILSAIDGYCARAAELFQSGDVDGALRALIGAPHETIELASQTLPEILESAGADEPAILAMRSVIENFPGDSGILVAAVLEHHQLLPGQALYVPAGIIHAYVHGIGVEVMASSDNVFRLGLTPKQVAVDEALESLDASLESVLLTPKPQGVEFGGELRHFGVEDSPFVVDQLDQGAVEVGSGHYRVLLAVDGLTEVSSGSQVVTLKQGQAVVMTSDEPPAMVETKGTAFICQSS